MPATHKHSVLIAGHRTSISLEPEFWQALRVEADREGRPIAQLVEQIDRERQDRNLSSALRVYILQALQAQHGATAPIADSDDSECP